MSEQAVTNSACLIALDRIGHVDLLRRVFSSVLAPPAVQSETGILIAWLDIREVSTIAVVSALKTQLDSGEACAIALAAEVGAPWIILDDKKARRVAKQMGLRVIGTIGVLLRAKKQRLLPAVGPALAALQAAGFRMSDSLHREALRLAGEDVPR